jgi:sialate O-acetylesterase
MIQVSHRALWLSAALMSSGIANATEPSLLHEIFQDHAVLQRDREVTVWGDAKAGETVTVTLNGSQASAKADKSGHWSTQLPALKAGGPYELDAKSSSGAEQKVADVLVGDVFLCSGQSNMEFHVASALNSWGETKTNNPNIRMLTVAHDTSAKPLSHFRNPVQWQLTTPENVPNFSAVCYFFARELQKNVPVPIGLIHSSWGGSKIEPWMSDATLRSMGGNYGSMLDVLALTESDPQQGARKWGEVWRNWYQGRVPNSKPWSDATQKWPAVPNLAAKWEQWGVPELADYNGMVWFHTTVTLTAQQAKQTGKLTVGHSDDVDTTWVNGISVGSNATPDALRTYDVHAGILKPGKNLIVVNVLDLYASGGLHGDPDEFVLTLADGSKVPFASGWEYQIAPKSVGDAIRAPWDATGGVSILGNAMIAPLGHLPMRGVAWYQGESNTGAGSSYQALMKAWMKEWRGKFGENASFYIVQLANYGAPATAPVESGWAELRDAQRRAVIEDGNAGLAVTIDLGTPTDIHPADKQNVGKRLARAARHVTYGENITPSGPRVVGARRDANEVVVSFTDTDGSMVAYSNDHPIGFELCTDEKNSCKYTLATIQGNSVRLDTKVLPNPTKVRYCWADSPVCTLYDGAALPASPFEERIAE